MAAPVKCPRLALYVREDTQHNMYRLMAGVVTLGPTPDYKDLGPRQIRNASDENPQRYRGLYLRDLEAVAYGHEWGGNEQPRSISFHDPLRYDTTSVDLWQAEKMARTLRTIEGRLAKLIEKQGYPESFGAYLAQLGAALRAESMVFLDGQEGRGSYDDDSHRFRSLGDGVAQVNYLARQWVETGRAVKDRRAA